MMNWTEPYRTELNWTELNWTELNWTELNWTELNWTKLNWTELNWTELTKQLAIKNGNSCLLMIFFMAIDHRRSSPFPASKQLDFLFLFLNFHFDFFNLLFCNTESTYSGTYLISIFSFIDSFCFTFSFHFSFFFFQPILYLFFVFFIFAL